MEASLDEKSGLSGWGKKAQIHNLSTDDTLDNPSSQYSHIKMPPREKTIIFW
jgi:hypothetical protein